ncbi:MAG TPA: hypothetical protein VK762_09690 [Polyangiaceae bacterium]|nr:hypothetical protein [Polyangiaceae bacterium]
MLRRLLLGVVVGLVLGGLLAAGFVRLFGTSFVMSGGGLLAFVSAAVAGALTGTVAGKPIWASGAKVEGGLKALFGALMAVGAMFALRQWATGFDVNLSFLGAGGPAPVGELPAASLPLISAVLGALFGLDNTPGGDDDGATRKRVSAGGAAGPRVLAGPAAKSRAEDDDDGADVAPRRAKR